MKVLVEFPLPEAHALVSDNPRPEDRLRAIERIEQALRVEEGSAGSIGAGADIGSEETQSPRRVSVDSSAPHRHGGIV